MRILPVLLFILFGWISSAYAVNEPLVVGVDRFAPPYIIQSANQKLYGFDIELMNQLCKILNRRCQFRLMRFDKLIPAVVNREVDVAIAAITITAGRAKSINFSLPYLLSYSRILQKTKPIQKPFTIPMLNNKKIGIESGSIFLDQITAMGIKDPIIKTYGTKEDLLNALSSGAIDYAILNNATAVYWASNSSESFTALGEPLLYGNGYGIAVNQSNLTLLDEINRALLQYENTPDYKSNYNNYFSSF